MTKVDIIYSGNIHAPNGASVLMKKLKDAQGLFDKYGVKQRLFSPDITCDITTDEENKQYVKETKIKRFVRLASNYFLSVSYFRYRRSMINPARRAIKQYDKVTEKGEVVVFHELWTCYEYLRKHKDDNKKIILIIHGEGKRLYVNMPRFNSILMAPYRKRIHNTIINGCHLIGFDANLPRRNFCKITHIDEKKTFYVYNGIDERPQPLHNKCDKLHLICVATLNPRKNQMGILNAIGMLDKSDQEKLNVIFVGDGPSRMDLEKKANSLYASVAFAGSMKERDYYDLLLKSNCFCLFSKSEGLPIAIIEAMRAGLPVIGSRVDGIPEEIEDGKTGFVVDLNEKALSERIKWMVNHLDLLPEMGYASYDLFMNHFTTEAMVKKYVEVYNS